jgi:hypothetical protein
MRVHDIMHFISIHSHTQANSQANSKAVHHLHHPCSHQAILLLTITALLLRTTRLTLARIGVLVTSALRPSSERVTASVLAALGLHHTISTAQHDNLMR